MPSRVLITMDDLSTAVPLNAALEAAGFATAMFSSLDDGPRTVSGSVFLRDLGEIYSVELAR